MGENALLGIVLGLGGGGPEGRAASALAVRATCQLLSPLNADERQRLFRYRDDPGATALHWAAENEQTLMVTTLLLLGCTVGTPDSNGHTVLHLLAAKPHTPAVADMLQMLVSHGGDVNAANGRGQRPLHAAAGHASGCTLTMHFLIECGAAVDAHDEDGITPLHYAVTQGDEVAIAFLLARGARTDISDKQGTTPLHRAVTWCQQQEQGGEQQQEQQAWAATAVQEAVVPKRLRLAEHLLAAAKADVARAGEAGLRGTRAADQLVNAAAGGGATALHLAAEQGMMPLVRLLLGSGADKRLRNAAGLTPRMAAAAAGHADVVALLDSSSGRRQQRSRSPSPEGAPARKHSRSGASYAAAPADLSGLIANDLAVRSREAEQHLGGAPPPALLLPRPAGAAAEQPQQQLLLAAAVEPQPPPQQALMPAAARWHQMQLGGKQQQQSLVIGNQPPLPLQQQQEQTQQQQQPPCALLDHQLLLPPPPQHQEPAWGLAAAHEWEAAAAAACGVSIRRGADGRYRVEVRQASQEAALCQLDPCFVALLEAGWHPEMRLSPCGGPSAHLTAAPPAGLAADVAAQALLLLVQYMLLQALQCGGAAAAAGGQPACPAGAGQPVIKPVGRGLALAVPAASLVEVAGSGGSTGQQQRFSWLAAALGPALGAASGWELSTTWHDGGGQLLLLLGAELNGMRGQLLQAADAALS